MTTNGVIMALGSPNDREGNLYSVGLARCRQAAALWRDNPDWHVLPTGGYGDHFNTTDQPHAFYLKQQLIEDGVPEGKILEFTESRNTLEDASLSKPIVLSHGFRVAVVITSDYHLPRARFIFNREYTDAGVTLLFIGAPTDEEQCEFDLAGQKKHEQESLKRLMEQEGGV